MCVSQNHQGGTITVALTGGQVTGEGTKTATVSVSLPEGGAYYVTAPEDAFVTLLNGPMSDLQGEMEWMVTSGASRLRRQQPALRARCSSFISEHDGFQVVRVPRRFWCPRGQPRTRP